MGIGKLWVKMNGLVEQNLGIVYLAMFAVKKKRLLNTFNYE